MINPSSIMKLMNARARFADTHPKFAAFLQTVFAAAPEEGTIIEVTVTKPGQSPVTSNLKVQPSDLELLQELKEITQNR